MSSRCLSAAQARSIDRKAVEQLGMPTLLLMEHAAIALEQAARELLESNGLESVLVIAGPGNNGGDGFAAARLLHNRNIPVWVLHTRRSDLYRGDAATNLHIIENMGLKTARIESIETLDRVIKATTGPLLLIDALLGTGVDRPADGLIAELIGRINERQSHCVLSVDVPSGMDADRGPIGPCVRADCTVTFVGPKIGMTRPEADAWIGKLVVGDIGIPKSLVEQVTSSDQV